MFKQPKYSLLTQVFCALVNHKILIHIMKLNKNSQMVVAILSTLSPMQHKSAVILHTRFKIKVYNGSVNTS